MIVPFKLETGVFIFIDLKNRNRVFDTLEFDFIYPFNNGVSIVKRNNKYGLVSIDGSLISPPIYDSISNVSEGYALIMVDGKHGIIDLAGRLIIPPKYQNLSNVNDGLILFAYEEDLYKNLTVNEEIKYGYLNLKNEVVIEPQYTPAEDFSEGLAAVGKFLGLDEDYNSIIKYGYIDPTGKTKIDFQFEYAESFKNGVALVTKNEKKYFIDLQGNRSNIEANQADDNVFLIKFIQKHETSSGFEGIIETFGFKNKSGKIVIPPIYTDAHDFENGLALVSVNSNYFFIMPDGEELCHRIISY